MFKLYFSFIFLFIISFLKAQTTAIPDTNFEQALIDLGIDKDFTINGQVSNLDIEDVTELDLYSKGIQDLTGIDGFIKLKRLNISSNNIQESLDFSKNTELEYLDCSENPIPKLDVSKNLKLIGLYANGMPYGIPGPNEIIVNGAISLETLNCSENPDLSYIDLSGTPNLKHLNISRTFISSIDISQNLELESLDCSGGYEHAIGESENGYLKVLDVSKNINLITLYCEKNNLESLFLNQSIIHLNCQNNKLKELNISFAINLEGIDCSLNPISQLNISNNINLTHLNCNDGIIEEIQTDGAISLKSLFCYNNYILDLDLSQNTNLEHLSCYKNRLENLNLKNGNNITLEYVDVTLNSNLTCIQVDNKNEADSGTGVYAKWNKDATSSYSEDCNSTAGIDHNLLSEGLYVFPNPVKDYVIISSKIPIKKIELFTILGKKVKEIDKDFSYITLRNLSKGIYIIKIFSEKGIAARKLIKE